MRPFAFEVASLHSAGFLFFIGGLLHETLCVFKGASFSLEVF
jgi:hypothetical protein